MKKGHNPIMKYLNLSGLKIALLTLCICVFGDIGEAQILGDNYNFNFSHPQLVISNKLRIEKGTKLKRALELLKQQFGVVFLYRTDVIQNRKVTSSKLLSDNVEEALKELFKGQGLAFKRINPKTYAIYIKPTEEHVQPEEPALIRQYEVKGTVTDASTGDPLPGANVVLKGTSTGTATDAKGDYVLDVSSASDTLVFSYIGYESKIIPINGRHTINVGLTAQTISGKQLVVVGYGTQKKSSVVASITSVSSQELEKTGGSVPDIGMALTGKLPGVITITSTGLPGDEQPQIYIRGQSTWHNAQPLILVDGVERPLNSVDMSAVASVTVLKDASATAVYGVRGANGVILITTKTGTEGKAQISGSVNSTIKTTAKLPSVEGAYATLELRDRAIAYELNADPSSWGAYLNQGFINHYRKPQSPADRIRYANVDWDNALFRNYTSAYEANLNVRGGTRLVKYFASANYRREGDLIKQFNNSRGYTPGFNFQRLNARTNLSFQITPSTTVKAKLFGSYGVKKRPWGFSGGDYPYWSAAYSTPPTQYLPQYPDGTFGFYGAGNGGINSVETLALSGIEWITTTQFTTNFELDQNLDMLVKGLSLTGKLAVDNTFVEGDRGINDLYNGAQEKYIDPFTGAVTLSPVYETTTLFDFQQDRLWATQGGSVRDGSTYRKLYYLLQLNYDFTLGEKNHFTEMGLFNRTQDATGSIIPHRRENMVFRTTYNYDDRYIIEYNGSYNGSEKFAPKYRFGFFSSGGLAWNVSNEKFMKSVSFINNLKLRGSYGTIGDDNAAGRWLYLTKWAYGGYGDGGENSSVLQTRGWHPPHSPYTWYRVATVGNPDVHWATVTKTDIGLDIGLFDGQISGSVDYFKADRDGILIAGDDRAIPSYFGQTAPPANLGKVKNQGYELSLSLDHRFGGLRLWSKINATHAKNEVIQRDDPALLPEYQKQAGKAIGQARTAVDKGFYNTWDELYATTKFSTNDNAKLPGGQYIIDYNGDGIIDDNDVIPYGYSGTPQNTYSTTVGFNWKGFSGYVQFYGVNNVTRWISLSSLGGMNLAYDVPGGYWSMDNQGAQLQMPRWKSQVSGYSNGASYMYDASYLRLKNAQIAYTFGPGSALARSLGIRSFEVYINGNNLLVWTDMPTDRESNFAGGAVAGQGAYPTIKRYNVGVNINF